MRDFHDILIRFYSFWSSDSTRALQDYKGKVVLIVNTANRRGLTPQYQGCRNFMTNTKAKDSRFWFPRNQFMGQAPGSAEEINSFLEKSQLPYDLPCFAKIKVNEAGSHFLSGWKRKSTPFGLEMSGTFASFWLTVKVKS